MQEHAANVDGMPDLSPRAAEEAAHWDAAYADGDEGCSWTQPEPTASLEAIGSTGAALGAPVVDVGGGSSRLAGALLARGYTDVTVVDLSRAALELARARLGPDGDRVTWIAANLLDWEPAAQHYAVWHDRAVVHFLTDDADRDSYAAQVRRALTPGGHAIIATFAPDGPERCSGLPVRRSAPEDLARLLGPAFTPVSAHREVHRTPSGREQAFSWLVARRDG